MSESELSFWANKNMQPPLSNEEKALRHRFAEEYIKDFAVRAAAMRMGFIESVSLDYGMRLLNDPYTQKLLNELQMKAAEDVKNEEEETKRRIRAALLREAHYHGPGSSHAARVSALAKLSAFYGMDAPVKSKVDVNHLGGVMAVPGIATVDDWEAAAEAAQENLLKETQANG